MTRRTSFNASGWISRSFGLGNGKEPDQVDGIAREDLIIGNGQASGLDAEIRRAGDHA